MKTAILILESNDKGGYFDLAPLTLDPTAVETSV
jgi:hypothetical protein